MKARQGIALLLLGLVAVGGCSYSLPADLQSEVDELNRQNEGLYATVRSIDKMGKDGTINASAVSDVKRTYGDLVIAYDNWRTEWQRVIKVEINNFEADDKYENAVRKLKTASAAFQTAADAVRGEGAAPTVVPDWPDEARDLLVMTQHERKYKKAANAIQAQTALMGWDEIAK